MDYDELTLNPMLAENEAEASSGGDPDGEKKSRRYWTPKEEDRFYEIWGRENWRLTRYGKNTIFFAQWSEELIERWNIDVKPEEVQAKVNQTKAKYRQVVKHMELEKTNVTKWKKFDVIGKILRNEYRPKDAEPISADALEKSREFSPLQPLTKTIISDTLTGQVALKQESNQNSLDLSTTEALGTNNTDLEPLSNSVIFNNSDSQRSTSQFNTELFTDPIDEIKQEEFQEEFDAYDVQNSNLYNQTQPQLTQLQTPQQQHQQQQQQQQEQQQQQQQQEQYQEQQYQAQPQTMHAQQQLQQHIQQLQQHQQQPQIPTHPNFDQTLNSFAVAAPPSNPRSLLVNNQNHYNNSSTPTPPMRQQSPAQPNSNQFVNNYGVNSGVPAATETLPHATTTNSNNNTSNNGSSSSSSSTNSMQPPRINAFTNAPVVQTRKRRTSMQIAAANAAAAAAIANIASSNNDSLELLYMEEVRKKNQILDEQKEISRKRLLLEERKIALMEEFFPRCLELQEQILQKLNSA